MAEGTKGRTTLARHTLAYVNPHSWLAMTRHDDDAVLRDWAQQGRPAIVRRPACADTADMVPLGVPLPPANGKRRVALQCPANAIVKTAPPPLLRDAAQAAPEHWQITIAQVLMLAPGTACFGSLAWAYLTGLTYLSDASDLDLILSCASKDDADLFARKLAAIDETAPLRIDAELVNARGDAVQWREWTVGGSQVLTRSMSGVRLIDPEEFLV
jgi:phosphoribosyl-dephospho-CoA transferase